MDYAQMYDDFVRSGYSPAEAAQLVDDQVWLDARAKLTRKEAELMDTQWALWLELQTRRNPGPGLATRYERVKRDLARVRRQLRQMLRDEM